MRHFVHVLAVIGALTVSLFVLYPFYWWEFIRPQSVTVQELHDNPKYWDGRKVHLNVILVNRVKTSWVLADSGKTTPSIRASDSLDDTQPEPGFPIGTEVEYIGYYRSDDNWIDPRYTRVNEK